MTTIVKRNVPDARGLPEMTPVLALRLRPDGSEADGRVQLYRRAAGRREREPIALPTRARPSANVLICSFGRRSALTSSGRLHHPRPNGEHDWEGTRCAGTPRR